MKANKQLITATLLLSWMAATAPLHAEQPPPPAPLRVACVGDSITYGAGLPNWGHQYSYPAVLQQTAGEQWLIGNFGVNGATALPGTGREWRQTAAAQKALRFSPDIVIIMLGINDLFCCPERHDQYGPTLEKLVREFQNLDSTPILFVCTLTPVGPASAPQNDIIHATLNPAIRAACQTTGAHLIDISAVFPNQLDFLPDNIHPSSGGYQLIAETIYTTIRQHLPTP